MTNGTAAALLLSHISMQLCSFVAPCRRPLIATLLSQSRKRCTSSFGPEETAARKHISDKATNSRGVNNYFKDSYLLFVIPA